MEIAIPIFLLLLVLLTALAAFNIQWNVFLKAYHRGTRGERHIALTFDDGPHPVYTARVLEMLKEHGVRATFFCIGSRVAQHPELVWQLHDEGHTIGNHSFTHSPTIDFHSAAEWLEELRRTDGALAAVIGHCPLFFRPPYGVTTPHLAKAVRRSGHLAIGWRVRPYDTLKRTTERIVGTILNKVKPGDIILLHDTHDRIVPVLERLLPELKKRNFKLVTVDQLIKRHAYAQI